MGIFDWSKTPSSNGVLEAISWAEGMAPGNVNNGVRAIAAALKEFQEDLGCVPTSSGTNTITLTTNSTIGSLADGLILGFTAGGSNTGASTFNPDSVGAQDLKKYGPSGLTALVSGDIIAGGKYLVAYESTNADWILLNPTFPSLSGYYSSGGTDVPVTDGGTGASTASGARTNLGLAIGSDVQAYDAVLADLAGLTLTEGDLLYYDGANLAALTLGGGLSQSSGVLSAVQNVQQTVKSDTASTTSTSFADLISVAITPVSASSKVLVRAVLQYGGTNVDSAHFKLLRGSTAICVGDSASNRSQISAAALSTSDNKIITVVIEYLDSPSTTSETTYKVQWARGGFGATTLYINRTVTDSDASTYPRLASTITATEIPQ